MIKVRLSKQTMFKQTKHADPAVIDLLFHFVATFYYNNSHVAETSLSYNID